MANGILGNLAPAIQAMGASLMSGGDLTRTGTLLPQFQQAAANRELRNLQIQQANRQLADAERERAQEQAMSEAVRGGLFGANLTDPQRDFLAANPALAGRVMQAQLSRLPQRPQTGRFKQDPTTGMVLDTATGEFRTPTGQPPGTLQASTGGRRAVRPILDPVKKANVESKLRSDFFARSKTFLQQRDALGRLEEIAALPKETLKTGAQDLGLIFSFMKILDPGSVVREGEFANAQNARGVPARVRSAYNNLLTGQRLDQTSRQEFVRTAQAAIKKARGRHARRIRRFTGIAERSGVDPQNVVDEGAAVDSINKTVGPPPAAIAALQANAANPEIVRQFDEKYGQGAAERALMAQ